MIVQRIVRLIKASSLSILAGLMFVACESEDNLYPEGYHHTELPDKRPEHSVFLIGDAGIASYEPREPALVLLQKKLEASDMNRSSVVFLGDNIYPSGLRETDHPDRKQDESYINAQLDIVKNFRGRVVFIPGNHDWFEGNTDGDEYIDRQAKYIENYLDRGDTFLPTGGCPGPTEIELAENLTWLIIDTQWWLHIYDPENTKPADCAIQSDSDFLNSVRSTLEENADNQILISAHHPLYSNSRHGGYFPIKDHIFPLTQLNKYLYIPLPLVGSIYPLYRKYIGNIQDIPHKRYTALRDSLTAIFADYPNIIYTSGHDHNLQYQKHGTTHYIVSGSGSKEGYVHDNDDLIYGRAAKGFAALHYFDENEVWLEFYSPISENPNEAMYRNQIVQP